MKPPAFVALPQATGAPENYCTGCGCQVHPHLEADHQGTCPKWLEDEATDAPARALSIPEVREAIERGVEP